MLVIVLPERVTALAAIFDRNHPINIARNHPMLRGASLIATSVES